MKCADGIIMNTEQLHEAEDNMIKWLADTHELGERPYKIEYRRFRAT